MLRGVLAALAFAALASPTFAMCGERGGPGCRLPNGKCASWAQAAYCQTHPEAAEAPAAGLGTGQVINENLKRPLLAMPAAASPMGFQLDTNELAALDLWISRQPDPRPSRPEALRRIISEALTRQ
ncbi:hypothetical protein SAMN05519103_03953 [Rhizobiales bacterium GAS113]|nr:hypothetical protein SAMN05519103_03953 [Rhizobiales bacterium GAS113]